MKDNLKTNLNGLKVSRTFNTLFVALPEGLWRNSGIKCQCEFCKGQFSMYDTLAMDANAKPGERDHTWMVHKPELTKSHITIRSKLEKQERQAH